MTNNPPHVFKDSDITEETILVPARMIKMAKPTRGGKMYFTNLKDKLLKRMTTKELKTKYLGWFLISDHVYPRAFLRWTDGVDKNDAKYIVYQPMQVKLAEHFYKGLHVEAAEACKGIFKSLKEIRWHPDGTSNPACISMAVVRDGQKYVAPRYTLAQLTHVVKKNVPRKRKKPTPKKETGQDQPKTKRSKRKASLTTTTTTPLGNEDALRELQQTQSTLEESIFQNSSGKGKKKKKKKRSRSSVKKQQQKNLAKKQRKSGTVVPTPPTKDRWGYLNPQMFTHWKKASFSMRDTLGWASRIFKKHKKPVLVIPEAGKPCPAKFTHFPSPDDMVIRGKAAHAMENPLNFTEHHRWIAEIPELQWAKEPETSLPPPKSYGTRVNSSPIVIPALPPPIVAAVVSSQKDPSFLRSALVRKPATSPPISLSATPREEMEILGFAFHQDRNGGGGGGGLNIIPSVSFSSHMLLYADQGDQDTNVVSKYRIKHVENQGLFRVLSMTREWLIKRQIWNEVLRYDPWCGIEDAIKNLHVGNNNGEDDEKADEKLFLCISDHLKTSDPVDLYYEFHDKVLKQLENAMADKSDSVKATVDRARTIFNSLSKIQNPTRNLAASSRGFQGERLKVLMILVHCMIVLKGQTQNVDPNSKWQDMAFQTMELPNEDSMYSGDITLEDQDQNEWHRNRFTSATVRIWDGMRQHKNFFSGIQKMVQERGFKKIKTISDFMAHEGSLGHGRFRFYILNTFNHLFPYGCPEARLDNSVVSAKQLQEENQEFQQLTQQLTKAFGLSSKAYLGI